MMPTKHSSLSKERQRTPAGKFSTDKTVGKIVRDAETMKRLATYVVELDTEGNVARHYPNPPFEKLVDCILVLAPVVYHGQKIDQAVVLEIGLGRFNPYAPTEYKASNTNNKKGVVVVPKRTQLDPFPWEKLRHALPVLWKVIQICIDERLSCWGKARLIQEKLQGSKTAVFESWMMIRIPKNQKKIYAILRLKDEIDKQKPGKNYHHLAETISREFKVFRKLKVLTAGKHSDEDILSSQTLYGVAKKIKRNIDRYGYTTRSIETVKKLLSENHDPADTVLLDDVIRIFKAGIPPEALDIAEFEELLSTEKEQLISECMLNPCRVFKYDAKRTKHAQDCYTISIFGTRETLIRITDRNTATRLNREDDSDIPF